MRVRIEELRAPRAGRLLEIWREVQTAGREELEIAVLCNARVLAESCYTAGEPSFTDEQAVLNTLTFSEMRGLLEILTGQGGQTLSRTVNPEFDAVRFQTLQGETGQE